MASTTMTYTILTGDKSTEGSIRYWAQHSLIPAAQILEEAQAFIYERIRAREMRTEGAVSVADAGDTIDLPTGFLDPIKLTLDGLGEIIYVHEDILEKLTDADGNLFEGPPTEYAIWDEKIQFARATDAAYAGDLLYYGTPAALSGANETNFLTDRFPTLLRRACLMYSYEHRHRPDLFQAELALVEQAIRLANTAEDMSRRGQIMAP